MSTTRKERPLIYVKRISIYCIKPSIEQKINATMEAHGFISISKSIRYLLKPRKVDIHFMEYSLDDTMWLLCAVRNELQLLEISIAQIKKNVAEKTVTQVIGNHINLQIFDEPDLQLMDIKTRNIFDIIAKLSYLWLPK